VVWFERPAEFANSGGGMAAFVQIASGYPLDMIDARDDRQWLSYSSRRVLAGSILAILRAGSVAASRVISARAAMTVRMLGAS